MRVAVCIGTLHRPVGLARLLASVAALDDDPRIELSVVVVDNDPEGSAREVVDAARPALRRPTTYGIQPARGIPHVRNRAVQLAGDVDLVAFVDDDEAVEPTWLTALLDARVASGADVVTGPVLPRFDEPPPRWVLRGRFFERPRFPSLTRIPYARTSNVLIDAGWLRRDDAPFSPLFALNGGDDTHLFQRIRLAGGRIVWADDAVVHEWVPPSRVRTGWLLRREYRRGNTLSLCLRDLEDSPRRRVKRLGAAGYHALRGLLTIATAAGRGRPTLVRGLQRVAFAAGLVTGLSGHVYEEYARVHGS